MKRYAIGIDLGGTSVKYALIDSEGVFHFQGRVPSKADVSAEAVVGQILYSINEVKAYAASNDLKIDGIGIGTPGIVDATSRIVMGGAENIKGWENVRLAECIELERGCDVYSVISCNEPVERCREVGFFNEVVAVSAAVSGPEQCRASRCGYGITYQSEFLHCMYFNVCPTNRCCSALRDSSDSLAIIIFRPRYRAGECP